MRKKLYCSIHFDPMAHGPCAGPKCYHCEAQLLGKSPERQSPFACGDKLCSASPALVHSYLTWVPHRTQTTPPQTQIAPSSKSSRVPRHPRKLIREKENGARLPKKHGSGRVSCPKGTNSSPKSLSPQKASHWRKATFASRLRGSVHSEVGGLPPPQGRLLRLHPGRFSSGAKHACKEHRAWAGVLSVVLHV